MKSKTLILVATLMLAKTSLAAQTGSCAPLDEDGNEIGTCTWTLDGDTLTFSGRGPMKDYGTIKQGPYNLNTTDAPWNDRDSSFNTGSLYQIRNVVVEDGITSVGNNALSAASKITSITIGDDVKTIGDHAFYYANGASLSLLNLDLGKGVETLGPSSFHSSKITNLVLPDKLKKIGGYALWDVLDENIVLPASLESMDLGLPWYNLKTLYCEEKNEKLCQDIINATKNNSYLSKYSENLSYETYTLKGDRYIFGGTAYKSIADYYNNEPVKRIYTIDEATRLSKPTGNTFKLRYK